MIAMCMTNRILFDEQQFGIIKLNALSTSRVMQQRVAIEWALLYNTEKLR